MSVYDELTRAIQGFGNSFEEKKELIRGVLGYTDSDGVYAVKEPGNSALYRVRIDNRSFVTAYHNGRCNPDPDLAVWLEIDDMGRYIINSVDITLANIENRDNPSQVFTAPHSHGRGSGMEFPIDPRLLSAFQIRPISGLQIYINGGAYQYEGQWKWFGGDTIDLTTYVPSSANKHRWAVLTLDHPTSTIVVKTGTEQSITSPLTLEQIESITVTGIPIGAVRLRNGQTSILETDLEALHILADGFPKHNYTATTAPTVNDDELDGYGVDSRWFDQVSLVPYFCIDATAGAAVWISGGSNGSVPITTAKEELSVWQEIETQTLSSAGTFDFQNIPQTYDDLEIQVVFRSNRAASNFDYAYAYANADYTATNYRYQRIYAENVVNGGQADSSLIMQILGSTSLTNEWSYATISIKDYTNSSKLKVFELIGASGRRTATAQGLTVSNVWWESLSAITRFELRCETHPTNQFITGSYAILRGRKKINVVTEVSGTQSELFPITLDYTETIPTNRQIVLSHVNIVDSGDLIINGTVVFVGDDEE
jgi:hypothetical protein